MATKAKKKPAARKRSPKDRGRQGYLEGMEPERNKEVEAAGEELYGVQQERIGLTKQEKEAMDSLVETMLKNNISRYESPDGLIITVMSKTKCKVARKKASESNGDGGGEE